LGRKAKGFPQVRAAEPQQVFVTANLDSPGGKPSPYKASFVEEASVSLFPVFLKLAGRPCLVVGAGRVGEPKIDSLLAAGATVNVIAPEATDAVSQWARAGKISWQPRPFEASDLFGIFLVVVATSSRELNESVYREARRRNVLCNVVDDPPRCDFYYPAVVSRGELKIAISTGGRSPALAQRLRRELEQQFGPEWEAWLEAVGRERQRLLALPIGSEERRRILHAQVTPERFEEFVQGQGLREPR
jgi:precorrin-2 dehydrogenase/sirohydrochlorin ferrochelatase